MEAGIVILAFFALMIVGIPVAVSLLISSLAYIFFMSDVPAIVVAQQALAGTDKFTLMAVPYFIVAGSLMQSGGISARIVKLARSLVGWMPGGLGVVTVVASVFFAAMTGAGAATTAAVGAMMIPAMIKDGYGRGFSTALQACGGVFGPIIPPSVLMVLYAVNAQTSVGDMLIAGLLPGMFLGVILIAYVMIYAKRRNVGRREPFSLKNVGKTFIEAFWALLTPIIILGGIYSGVLTPTEAAAVGCFYSVIVGVFVYRELTFRKLLLVLYNSFKGAAGIMLIVGATQAFGWVLTREGLPQAAALWFKSTITNQHLFMLACIVLFLIFGIFIDAVPNVLIFAPILTPVAAQYGIDLVHFGVVMVVAFCIGLVTPPVGVNLFVASEVGKVPLREFLPNVWPIFLILVLGLVVIAFVPQLSLILI